MQTIVHITDLHHSKHGTVKGDISRAFVGNVVNKLNELVVDRALGVDPILVFTGDLVQSGGGDEDDCDFSTLHEDVLVPICNAMGIRPNRVVICPGNHELDIIAVDSEQKIKNNSSVSSRQISEDMRNKLEKFFDFIERNNYQSVSRECPRIMKFEIGETKVVVLNALAGIYSDGDDFGNAFLTSSEMMTDLDFLEPNSVVCIHHPLEWFDEKTRPVFQKLLARKKCRLLSGHEHMPAVQIHTEGKGRFINIRGGAAGDTGESCHFSVINLSPSSEAITYRSFTATTESDGFEGPAVEDSKCYPENSRGFFETTRAFLTNGRIRSIAEKVGKEQTKYREELQRNIHGKYVEPLMAYYDGSQLNSILCQPYKFIEERGIIVVGGDELSGKSTLVVEASVNSNLSPTTDCITLLLDFRALDTDNIFTALTRQLRNSGCSDLEANNLLELGAAKVILDNFAPSKVRIKELLIEFHTSYPDVTLILVTAGGGQYSPSNSPSFLPESTIFYRLQDVTREIALKMAAGMPDSGVGNDLKLAARVFKSISSLGAPRSVFYVQNLLRMYMQDAAVEPLNQYLMQRNIITESMTYAHKKHWINKPYDADTMEMFIGELAFILYDKNISFVSKGELYTHIEQFQKRKGMLPKHFPADLIYNILRSSHLLREYEHGIGFMVTGLEDYFLAKHMTFNNNFRDYVLSDEGLLRLPSVAQLYVAQNPNDIDRIEIIFGKIDGLVDELKTDFRDLEDDVLREAINQARPNSINKLKKEVNDELAKLAEEETLDEIVLAPRDSMVRLGQRVNFAQEERAAIYIQLGASIIGVTRTLDAGPRKQLFDRLKPLIVIAMQSSAMLAQHLADGKSIKVRGTTIRANYVGRLKEEENRFFLILTSMLSNISNSFGVWAGSLSFYASAKELLEVEVDPLIATALLSQQVEADCEEAFQHLPQVINKTQYPALMSITVENYLDGIRMAPPESKDLGKQALHNLSEIVSEMSPPKAGIPNKKPAEDETRERSQRLNSIYQGLVQKINVGSHLGKGVVVKDVKPK